jgi:tricorn protease
MHPKKVFVTLLLLLSFVFVQDTFARETRLLMSPDVSNGKITFSYAGDIYVADQDGSNPVRLTIDEGYEYNPFLSPDGKWVAFTGEYDGNLDVYIVSVNGGQPKRLTYHPYGDITRGWTPDGKVMFKSARESYTRRYAKIWTVSVDGGLPESLEIPQADRLSMSPDGKYYAYTFIKEAFTTWKRYRGGQSSFIWIYDKKTMDVVEIPRLKIDNEGRGDSYANDSRPVWIDDKVYFISDRNFTMNVFSYDTVSKTVEQVTFHEGYDVKSLKGTNGYLAYSQGGEINIIDTKTNTIINLDIHLNPDLPDIRPGFVDASDFIETVNVSPNGVRAVFEARGELFTIPKEDGDTRNITNSPNVHDRYPAWSPDGKSIAYLSDEDGEYKIKIVDQKGIEEPKTYSPGEPDYYFGFSWSPDSKKLIYRDNGISAKILDVESGKSWVYDTDYESAGGFHPDWSFDSRYIAYAKTLPNKYKALFIYDIENKKSYQITDGMSNADYPVFSKDGKYLYFAASTNFAHHVSGLDMASYERPLSQSLYCIVLEDGVPSPFKPLSDEEEIEDVEAEDKEKDADKEEDAEDEEEEEKIVIDFDGIQGRIVALDEPEMEYYRLATSSDGGLFYIADDNGSRDLMKYDIEEQESDVFMAGVGNYDISTNGEHLLYIARGTFGIVPTSSGADIGDGELDTGDMEVYVNPKEQWRQILREVWRFQRDFFYDPDLHGADWDAVWKKYEYFLDDLGHREDLNYLIGELNGELVVGHAYNGGGDMPFAPSLRVGLLGADFEIKNNLYRFKNIYSGLNWNPDLRAPLREPGIDVNEGDYLLAINGEKITGNDNIYRMMENTYDMQLTLLVNDKPSEKDAREVIVKPIKSESRLRFFNWVEGNRKKVDEAP